MAHSIPSFWKLSRIDKHANLATSVDLPWVACPGNPGDSTCRGGPGATGAGEGGARRRPGVRDELLRQRRVAVPRPRVPLHRSLATTPSPARKARPVPPRSSNVLPAGLPTSRLMMRAPSRGLAWLRGPREPAIADRCRDARRQRRRRRRRRHPRVRHSPARGRAHARRGSAGVPRSPCDVPNPRGWRA